MSWDGRQQYNLPVTSGALPTGPFLKALRLRIDRQASSLGPYSRLSSRWGRIPSQEEVAEALNVSRAWYCQLESGARVRASVKLLARIADTLMLTDSERGELFRMAIPEAAPAPLQADTLRVLESLSVARRIAKRLWSVTSQTEALCSLSEAMADQFKDVDFVGGYVRIQPGLWQFPAAIGRDKVQDRVGDLLSGLCDGLTPAQIDEIMLHDALTEPGQVGTRHELHPRLKLARRTEQAFSRAGMADAEFISAHIRSAGGFEANVFAASLLRARDFSRHERALLSTITDVASLALSNFS
jgi:transcriptional regulator with XRE-family HTH domain